MSSQDTRTLIAQAIDRFTTEVPALKNLKLVVRLELRAKGGDVPIWRVELPGPKIAKDPAADARVDVSISRPDFNELAAKGSLKHWAEAYRNGHLHVSGDAGVIRLVGQVVQRQMARGQQLA